METRLIDLKKVPNEKKLLKLLGEKVFNFYNQICNTTISMLDPDFVTWDLGGRRGKYFHGYLISKKSITVDLYLYSSKYEQITCELHFQKRFMQKILKKRNLLSSKEIQNSIDFCIEFNEEYGGGYTISIRIRNEEELQDVLKIIKILSTRSKVET